MNWLVVCGLDGALLGDDRALAQANEEFIKQRSNIILAYLTGRSLASVLALKQQVALLPADYLACDSGTSLYRRDGEKYVPMVAWMNLLNSDWKRERVEAIAHRFYLEEQPPQYQSPFKCSYYLAQERAKEILPQLHEAVEQINAHLIYKSGFLDILPTNSAELIDYLRAYLNVDEAKTIACGGVVTDDHFTQLAIKSVFVPETPAAEHRNGAGIYYAQAPYAQGVLEGLRYWGIL
ncbi:HAD family hydrolase [Anthocerotibacter panamensis]|uniref:HAD family hydrolase n=1 Tax=Anthocerotibacter panamensis TaxID=2857077 RepID=UPI001C405064|nr:HAD family hydrolase [Anthocerotibacter panamensis]